MLRPFQVNVGSYLALNHDILPTEKVAQLCSSIETVSGEAADNQVLLTADGRQMDPRELIGNYAVGTENKPLFVFYRSFISTKEPPSISSRMPQRTGLQKQLDILKQRPSPAMFSHQVTLSKCLCEYSVELERLSGILFEEYTLQLGGWNTVLSNCRNLIGMFLKHHQLFCKAVDKFREDKVHNLDLLQKFPEQLKLLHKLPVPSSLGSTTSISLYDWISTHDEKNSLMDLSVECKKALAKVDSEHLEMALQSSQELNEKSAEVLSPENDAGEESLEKIKAERAEVKKLMETITGLGKNIQMTSEKALRSGDARTIAQLVESHHKSLQLMNTSTNHLEAIVRGEEGSKRSLTTHIHTKMKKVMELQRRVAECNGQLVLLHEHIKLAHKRFEILEQVCSTPQVLVEVCGEVGRRRAYNTALEKVMEDTISRLHRARLEEKRLRKSFQSNCGVHFVTTLFPELQDRVPDITFHSPKSLTKSYDDNLETICNLLPQDMRPSTELATSLQLLTQPFFESPRTDVDSSGESFKLAMDNESPYPTTATTKSAELDSSEDGHGDAENLKELVGRLELANIELTSKLQKSVQMREALRGEAEEKESTYLGKLRNCEEVIASLEQRVSGSREEFEREKLAQSHHIEELKHTTMSTAEELVKRSHDLQELTQQYKQLTAEREKAVGEGHKLNEQVKMLQHQHSLETQRLKDDLQDQLGRMEASWEKERLGFQDLLSQCDAEKQKFKSECCLKESALESKLSELQEAWERKRKSLEAELGRYQDDKSELLCKHSAISAELAVARDKLEEASGSVEPLHVELEVVRNERDRVQGELSVVMEELSRQQQRSQQAQATMNSNRAQLEALHGKRKELAIKLAESETERDQLSTKLQQVDQLLSDQDKELVMLKSSGSERSYASETRIKELENDLNQKNAGLCDQKNKLKSAIRKIEELEKQLATKKEEGLVVAEDGRLQQTVQELNAIKIALQKKESELENVREDKGRQKNELENKVQGIEAKLQKTIREHEEKLEKMAKDHQDKQEKWGKERDDHVKQVMELEREVKELKRSMSGQGSPSSPPSTKTAHRMSASAITLGPADRPDLNLVIHSFQIGQIALFMCDQYGNYLALGTDSKTYYLDSEYAHNLQDLTARMKTLMFKGKILVGRITGRLYMEVRKENNRLKVPVGSRLYKLQAEPVPI